MAGEENKKINIDAEELKNQTKDTVKQVKDTIKDVDFKNDTKEATGFVKEMFNNPFEAVEKVARGEENILKKSIVIMILYIVASALCQVIYLIKYGRLSNVGTNLMGLVRSILSPVLYVLVPAVVIFIMNKNNKKSLPVVLMTLITAAVPMVVVEVINVLESIVGAIRLVSSPISTGLISVSAILTYFGIKELFAEEEHNKFIKTFAIIEVVSALIFYLLSSAGIY